RRGAGPLSDLARRCPSGHPRRRSPLRSEGNATSVLRRACAAEPSGEQSRSASSLVARGNGEIRAILSHCAPGEVESPPPQRRCQSDVGERVARILAGDQGAQAVLGGGGGDQPSVYRSDPRREEGLEREDAMGRVDELRTGGTADRRLVHANLIGHLTHPEW